MAVSIGIAEFEGCKEDDVLTMRPEVWEAWCRVGVEYWLEVENGRFLIQILEGEYHSGCFIHACHVRLINLIPSNHASRIRPRSIMFCNKDSSC